MTASQHRVRRVEGPLSTDDIIPGRYKHMYTDPNSLAPHVFEGRFPGLAASFTAGDMLCCDDIFGIGSSREQAATSLLAAGVVVVAAPAFGRIFFRNAWNVGLRLIEADLSATADEGEDVWVDWAGGSVQAGAKTADFLPPADRVREIADCGGLLRWVQIELRAREA